MTRRWIGSVVLIAVLLGLFAQAAGQAQDTPAPKVKRTLYVVRHGDAKELASALSKHFKDDADIQPVQESNVLLVRAAPGVIDEVTKLLATLDRRPRRVMVELYLVDAAASVDDKPLDEKEFTGAEKTVLEKIDALKKKGAIGEVRRFQFTTLEGSPTTISVGESKAFTTSVTALRAGGKGGAAAPGQVARNVSYRDLGTKTKATARVGDGKNVVLDLDIQDSRIHTAKDGVVIGQDENAAPIRAPDFILTYLKSKVTIPAGQVIAAKDVQSTSKAGQTRTLILATARVVDADKGGEKE